MGVHRKKPGSCYLQSDDALWFPQLSPYLWIENRPKQAARSSGGVFAPSEPAALLMGPGGDLQCRLGMVPHRGTWWEPGPSRLGEYGAHGVCQGWAGFGGQQQVGSWQDLS